MKRLKGGGRRGEEMKMLRGGGRSLIITTIPSGPDHLSDGPADVTVTEDVNY